jgi:hypothetical protein
MTETEPMVPFALLADVLKQLAELKATMDLTLLAVVGIAETVDGLAEFKPPVYRGRDAYGYPLVFEPDK